MQTHNKLVITVVSYQEFIFHLCVTRLFEMSVISILKLLKLIVFTQTLRNLFHSGIWTVCPLGTMLCCSLLYHFVVYDIALGLIFSIISIAINNITIISKSLGISFFLNKLITWNTVFCLSVKVYHHMKYSYRRKQIAMREYGAN